MIVNQQSQQRQKFKEQAALVFKLWKKVNEENQSEKKKSEKKQSEKKKSEENQSDKKKSEEDQSDKKKSEENQSDKKKNEKNQSKETKLDKVIKGLQVSMLTFIRPQIGYVLIYYRTTFRQSVKKLAEQNFFKQKENEGFVSLISAKEEKIIHVLRLKQELRLSRGSLLVQLLQLFSKECGQNKKKVQMLECLLKFPNNDINSIQVTQGQKWVECSCQDLASFKIEEPKYKFNKLKLFDPKTQFYSIKNLSEIHGIEGGAYIHIKDQQQFQQAYVNVYLNIKFSEHDLNRDYMVRFRFFFEYDFQTQNAMSNVLDFHDQNNSFLKQLIKMEEKVKIGFLHNGQICIKPKTYQRDDFFNLGEQLVIQQKRKDQVSYSLEDILKVSSIKKGDLSERYVVFLVVHFETDLEQSEERLASLSKEWGANTLLRVMKLGVGKKFKQFKVPQIGQADLYRNTAFKNAEINKIFNAKLQKFNDPSRNWSQHEQFVYPFMRPQQFYMQASPEDKQLRDLILRVALVENQHFISTLEIKKLKIKSKQVQRPLQVDKELTVMYQNRQFRALELLQMVVGTFFISQNELKSSQKYIFFQLEYYMTGRIYNRVLDLKIPVEIREEDNMESLRDIRQFQLRDLQVQEEEKQESINEDRKQESTVYQFQSVKNKYSMKLIEIQKKCLVKARQMLDKIFIYDLDGWGGSTLALIRKLLQSQASLNSRLKTHKSKRYRIELMIQKNEIFKEFILNWLDRRKDQQVSIKLAQEYKQIRSLIENTQQLSKLQIDKSLLEFRKQIDNVLAQRKEDFQDKLLFFYQILLDSQNPADQIKLFKSYQLSKKVNIYKDQDYNQLKKQLDKSERSKYFEYKLDFYYCHSQLFKVSDEDITKFRSLSLDGKITRFNLMQR